MKKAFTSSVYIDNFDPAHSDEIYSISQSYSHHVFTGSASFDVVSPSPKEISRGFGKLLKDNYPVLVAIDESSGQVLGYAYCSPFKTRAAYVKTVEDSIYVRKDMLKQGIGRALLTELIEQTKSRGYLTILALIGDSKNHASIKLHSSLGFKSLGAAGKIGEKYSRDVNVELMQLRLLDEAGTD